MASQPIVLEIDKLRSATTGDVVEVDKIYPGVITASGEVLTYDGSNFAADNSFAQTTYVDGEITNLVGGATTAADTLGKVEATIGSMDTAYKLADAALQNLITTNATAITTLQTNVATNATAISTNTNNLATEVTDRQNADTTLQNQITANDSDILTLQTDVAANTLNIATNTTDIAQEESDRIAADAAIVGGATTNFDTLGKIEGEIGTLTTYVNTEVADLKTEILGGASGAYDTLLEIENHITTNATDIGSLLTTMATKAPLPPNGIAAGEFLRWDEVNQVFTFATPSTGSSGTTIPTPSATTDTTTAGSTEVLIWDNTAGDLKNVASPFAEIPPASSAGEYLSWNGTNWVNSTPAGGSASGPASPSATGEVITWDGSNFTHSSDFSIKPTTTSSPGQFLKWDGSLNSGKGGFINAAAPAAGGGGSVSGMIVQIRDNPQVGGEALSATGYSSKGFCSITLNNNNSYVLFQSSGTPHVAGQGVMYVHWRYRDLPSDPWSAYQDTGKVSMYLYDRNSAIEYKDSALAIHLPNRPAGAEIEYRVYFYIYVGTIYYPDPAATTSITNFLLYEIAP